MKRWLAKVPPYLDSKKGLRNLKILAIASPVIFVFLLDLFRQSTFVESLPIIWNTVLIVAIVLGAAFLYYKLFITSINRLQGERIRELEILNDLNQALDEFHNLKALLNHVMDRLIQITGADYGELYLINEHSRELLHTLHGGSPDDAFSQKVQLQLKEWLIGNKTRLNQPVLLDNLRRLQNGPIASLAEAQISSLTLVPLKSPGGTIGFVCLLKTKPNRFKLTNAKLLLDIGNRIALAIEKAWLYEKVQAVAVLEERERISGELHDGLAQILSYVITKSQAARQLLRKMTTANDYLVELEDVAQEVYTDTREAILGLRTVTSGDKSMVSALREYATRFNQMYNIKTELIVDDNIIPSLSPHIELQAIRIVQEALSNIRKHAEATKATIKIASGDTEVTLVIEDDGKGFGVDEKERPDFEKFGLRNMKERAESIHGRFIIESKPEHGTRVTLGIPKTFSQIMVKEGKEVESANS